MAKTPGNRPGILSILARGALPVGLLALGGLSYSILSVAPEKAKDPPAEDQVLQTRVTELRIRDYPVVITTHGVVQPHNEVILSAEVSGQITRISSNFEAGAYFSEGDVLVEIDSRDYATAVAIAEARRLGAQAALELAKLNYERNVRLFDRNIIPKADVNQAAASQSQALAELESAEAQLEQAKRDLERTKILAPFEGRVRTKTVGLGETIGASAPLGDIFAVDFAEVRLPIAGRELQFLDLPEMEGDRPVDVELRDAVNEASDAVWKAKIVRTEGVLDEDSLELFAIARIDDPFGLKSGHPPLRIGQPVEGAIAGKTLTNVVALPRNSVRQLDQVFLVDKRELTLMPMTIVPVWSDRDYVIVHDDPMFREDMWLSTTHLVYAPSGAKVEIIADPGIATVNSDTETETVAN